MRDDLATRQKLNVTAFLISGITAANPDLIGEVYRDKTGRWHLPMSVQPVNVLTGAANVLTSIRSRAQDRGVETVAYVEAMFATGHDATNRAVFAEHGASEANTVGMALRADRKIVDKITKVAKMHG